jgi:hypothetical protein
MKVRNQFTTIKKTLSCKNVKSAIQLWTNNIFFGVSSAICPQFQFRGPWSRRLVISVLHSIAGVHNPRRQVAVATKFCMVAPNICRPLAWNLVHANLLASRIWRWLLPFWHICATRIYCVMVSILNLIPYMLRTGKCQDKIMPGIQVVTRLLLTQSQFKVHKHSVHSC